MATKEISQLPSTNVSNDTDLLMTRQGSQDRAVQVETVRNVGTDPGQSLGVGGYGIGGNAISITSLYASNNANLIDRSGVYAVAGATNVPVAVGELKHWQTSATEATQEVIGQNQEAYFRKKVAGTWLAWVLYGAANKATVRTDLGVYSASETDNELLDLANGAAGSPPIQSDALNDYPWGGEDIRDGSLTNDDLANSTLGAEKFQSGTTERDWVLGRTATSTPGAVGTYALLRDIRTIATRREPGYTTSGSNLRYASTNAFGSTTPSGTWQLMGSLLGDLELNNGTMTSLWLRIS